ncbi:MAG: mandelate racemase/muconate lactonizing enzyme family protein [Pseudomonadota bacterium]
MKITRITVYQIELPYVGGSYGWAKGYSLSAATATVVRIDSDDGISGWGEVCPLGASYLPSYSDGVAPGIAFLAPHLIGRDPTAIGAIYGVMEREMLGHAYVKSALDMACWDILGQAAGLPLHALLGGRQNNAMPMYRAIPQGTPEEMAATIESYRQEGYRQFQLKSGGWPAEDIARLEAVCAALAPGERLLADGNRGWRRDEALEVAQATRHLSYIMEQPCSRYEDCLAVRRRAPHVFKLDESLQTFEDLVRARNDEACDVGAIKVAKSGGLTKARLARDFWAALGIPMTVEDVWGGEIVTAALAHLAASTPSDVLLNTTDLHNYNTVHFASGAPEVKDGHLIVGDRPGLGVTVEEDKLGPPLAVHE